ncbi:MAG: hypothetical protein DAHOPDDO_00604 [Ignavibacteriaceae bacterium]|nr:hypothetical protein [Ignavibacteriaceae bacterium]
MYTPKLSENLIRELYQLKLKVKQPITRLANRAIQEFLDKQRKEEIANERRS